jgi:hypothetical protein
MGAIEMAMEGRSVVRRPTDGANYGKNMGVARPSGMSPAASGLQFSAGMKAPLRTAMLCVAAMLVGQAASAADGSISLGEVTPPPPSSGVDVGVIHDAAERAIKQLEPSALRPRQRVVVSVAVTRAAVDPVDCTVNAIVRDARTGAMIAIIEAGAHASGPVSSELRKQVANAAVRNAIRRIPSALGAK